MATTTGKNSTHGPPRDDSKDYPQDPSAPPPDPTATSPGQTADPDLAMIWGDEAPPITPHAGKTSGSTGTPPDMPAFTVDLGSLREAMSSMLRSSHTAVDGYMNLKQQVAQAVTDPAIWGQEATYEDISDFQTTNTGGYGPQHPQPTGGFNGGAPKPSYVKADSAIQTAAKAFEAAIDPRMTAVLRQCADAIEMAGQYVVALDRAGTQYAGADQNSFFPDMPATPLVQ